MYATTFEVTIPGRPTTDTVASHEHDIGEAALCVEHLINLLEAAERMGGHSTERLTRAGKKRLTPMNRHRPGERRPDVCPGSATVTGMSSPDAVYGGDERGALHPCGSCTWPDARCRRQWP